MNPSPFAAPIPTLSIRACVQDIIEERVPMRIPVYDGDGKPIGTLEPFTKSSIDNWPLLEAITRWRNKSDRFFFTHFEPNTHRTRAWLNETVLADDSRLLFIIRTQSRAIGQLGFKGLCAEEAQLDNLIRGEIGGHPRLIYYSEVALLRWLFETFALAQVIALIRMDNVAAQALHGSLGFESCGLIALENSRQQAAGSEPQGNASLARKLALTRSRFEKLRIV
jgi:hypothetical protein